MATLTQTATYTSQCASSTSTVGHLALNPQSHSSSPTSMAPSGQCAFAFVRIYNDVCLVQTDASHINTKSPVKLAPVELAVFRHEFGTMFRLSRRARLPAKDVQVLAPLDEAGVLCDADSGVVFLAREMTDQLLRYTSTRRVHDATARPARRRY